MTPALPRPQPRGLMHKIGIAVLMVYVFFAIGRVSDLLFTLTDVNSRIPMISLLIVGAAVFLSGGILRALRSRITVLWIVFGFWLLIATALSIWKGGSVQMLVAYWIPSMGVYTAITGLTVTMKDCRRLLYTISASVFMIVLVYGTIADRSVQGRLSLQTGTLANSNFLALQLLFGLPFCVLLVMRKKLFSFWGFTAAGICLLTVMRILFTGSRAGLLGVLLVAILLFLVAPVVKKIHALAFGALLAVTVMFTVPSQTWERYSTMFVLDRSAASNPDEVSAVESSQTRLGLLTQGLSLTLRNPFFGVGPGMFIVATSDEVGQRTGQTGFWKESHNSYTQISSEAGVPALLLYVAILVITLKTLWSLYRQARELKLTELSQLALCVGLSLVATLVTGFFSNIGYHVYFPALSALTVVLGRIGFEEIRAARQRQTAGRPVVAVALSGGLSVPSAAPVRVLSPAATPPRRRLAMSHVLARPEKLESVQIQPRTR